MIRDPEQLRVHEFEVPEQNIYVCFAEVSDIDTESEEIRRCLSEYRLSRIDSIKKDRAKKLSAGAELMLVNAVRKKYPDAEVPVMYSAGEHGKPYFNDIKNAYFSLSHSGSVVACAVSNAPVGIDVQSRRKVNPALAKRFYSDSEYRAVIAEPEMMFNRIWARKEAVAKADGRGIAIGLKELNVLDSAVRHSGRLYLTLDIPSPWEEYHIAVSRLIGVCPEPGQE